MYVCPRCKATLTTVLKDGVEIEECSGCGGIWLDANELTGLIGGVESQAIDNVQHEDNDDGPVAVALKETDGIICPKCDAQKLISFIYDGDTGIELDTCPSCGGLWLDKNELKQIEFFADMNKSTKLAELTGQGLQTRRIEAEEFARTEFIRKMRKNAKARLNPFKLFVYIE